MKLIIAWSFFLVFITFSLCVTALALIQELKNWREWLIVTLYALLIGSVFAALVWSAQTIGRS